VTNLRRRQKRERPSPARLPATLLLAFLALVGATVLWLHLQGGPPEETAASGDGPSVEMVLGAAPAPANGPAEIPPPQPLPTESAEASPREAPAVDTADAVSVAPPAAAPRIRVSPARAGPPLTPAPDAALVEQTQRGPLPRAGRDGREPWQVYARPFDARDERPRISLTVTGLGVSEAVTRAAIEGLPGAITLAFSPYADRLDRLIALARAAGHEVLMMVPMEPVNYPVSDPGPQALMTSLETAANIERLHWALSRATGYVGIVSYMGSRFATSHRHVRPVLAEAKERGLLLLDSGHGSKSVFADIAWQIALPFAASTMFVDGKLSASDIDTRLGELERIAKADGRVVAMAQSYPVSVERIAAWAGEVEKRGFVLVPVSALVARLHQP
jgi:uncharacterized protein